MDFSLIIVNYNTTEHIIKCLDSLFEKTKNIEYEIIVVDNNSIDRSIDKLPTVYNKVRFIFRNINDGFGAGCNYGVKYARGKYIAFINPDITFINNALLEFYNYFEKNSEIGICSGILVDDKEIPQYCFNNFPNLNWEFHEAFGYFQNKLINKLLSIPSITNNEKKEFEVDWFHGACLVMKKDIFINVGGFDEKIFLYYEDVDLCYRVKQMQRKIICLPFVRLIHFQRSSVRIDNGSDIYFYNMHKSKIYYLNKHYSKIYVILIRLIFVLANTLKILILPFRIKYKNNLFLKYRQYSIIIKVHLNIHYELNI
jgi:GT2 family glycosyltransferase